MQQDLKSPHKAQAPSKAAQCVINNDLLATATSYHDDLVSWRHELHQIPELGLNTVETSSFVQSHLKELNVAFHTIVNSNAVVAQLGAGNGPCILLRADMDGLPYPEKSGEPWASKNGRSHSCGHDMHTTALLGAAKLLKAREEVFKHLGITVKFLFQPGEETFEGSRRCIEEGVLDNPHVDAAFAIHVNGRCPMGLIIYGQQALAGSYTFKITVQGHGGHGSGPQNCIDPITPAAHIHIALQEIMAREIGASEEAILTIGRFSGGTAPNAIPDECTLEGTLRAFDPDLMKKLIGRIEQISQSIAAAYRASVSIDPLSLMPPTTLDPNMLDACTTYVGHALPNMRFRNIQHSTGAEDFALFSERVPSAYFTIGAAVSNASEHFTMHDPRVRFDDAILTSAAVAYASAALGWAADHASD